MIAMLYNVHLLHHDPWRQTVKKSEGGGRAEGGRATINREVVQSVVHTFNTVPR